MQTDRYLDGHKSREKVDCHIGHSFFLDRILGCSMPYSLLVTVPPPIEKVVHVHGFGILVRGAICGPSEDVRMSTCQVFETYVFRMCD